MKRKEYILMDTNLNKLIARSWDINKLREKRSLAKTQGIDTWYWQILEIKPVE